MLGIRALNSSWWFTFRKVAFVLLVISAGSLAVRAQSTAVLTGTVTDSSHAVVPQAPVALTNSATGVQLNSTTDSKGNYLFPSVPIGVYTIQVKSPNFRTALITDVHLDVATVVNKDIQLEVGQVAQQVTVQSEASNVDTASSEIGQVIGFKEVQEFPLNGRHFVDLSLLTAGTVTPPQNGSLTTPLRGQGAFAFDTAGQREDTINLMINGINLNDPLQNQITFQPPVDTLAEVKIDNSTFSAQYGRNSGSIVNIATRSGANDYHGEAFDYLRNNALDARNYFNPVASSNGTPIPQAPFKRNNFGGTIGGPIKKEKMFFFLAYEGLRQHQSLTLGATVPSQEQIAKVTSPAALSLLKLVPAANLVGTGNASDPGSFNGFTGSTLANAELNQGSADLEIDLTKDDRIHGYYVIQRDLRIEPQLPGATPANIPGFGDSRNGQRQLMTINEDHVFSPSLLNTVRLGYSRLHLFNTPPVFNPANFHITLPVGAPIGVGLPLINVSGNFVIGAPTGEPSGRGDTEVVLNDTFNWLRGRNFFAIGGEIRLAYNNNLAMNIGSFTFPTMANFLADQSSAFATMLGTGNNRVSQPAYGLFAQDSLKFNPNFTLNIGLRYELNTSPSEAKGRFTNFDITSGTLFTATRPYQNNKLNLEPRIGIAWDPFGSGRTSVRAAYAILDQVPTTNLVNGLSGNPPFATPISITSSTNSITLENPTAQSASLNLGPSATDPNFDNLYTQDWNLNIERQLTQSLGLTVAYVGSKSTHLQIVANVNQPIVTSGFYGTTKPFPTLPLTSPVLPAQCAPPNPACVLGNITRNESPGNSNYNALWVTLNEHGFRGLQFVAAYTFSKSLDYSSIFTDSVPLQNARNPRGDYGLSEFDVRNRFILSGFYQLPFQGNRLTSGWEVGAITMAQSGNPITPLLTIGPGAGISFTVRPDALALVTGTGQPSQFYTKTTLCEPFNGTPTGGTPAIRPCASTPTAAFAVPCTFSGTPSSPGGSSYPVVPGTCHPGSTQRDSLPGPSFVDTDFSLIKDMKLKERLVMEARIDGFDLFNHPNFGNPVNTVTSSTFGVIQNTRFPTGDSGSSRQIQAALKLTF